MCLVPPSRLIRPPVHQHSTHGVTGDDQDNVVVGSNLSLALVMVCICTQYPSSSTSSRRNIWSLEGDRRNSTSSSCRSVEQLSCLCSASSPLTKIGEEGPPPCAAAGGRTPVPHPVLPLPISVLNISRLLENIEQHRKQSLEVTLFRINRGLTTGFL